VAVVNEQFARFYFGSLEAALGKTINGNVRIVGIAADAHYDTLRDVPARAVFTPFTQSPPRSAMTFVVRPAGASETAITNVLAAIRGHDPRLSVQVTSLAEAVRATLMRERFLAIVALVLSCVGVFLSCAGLYAAVSYATAERGAELAVRIALGATRPDIVSLVLREPVRVALAGIGIGLPGAYGIMRAASSLLYGIDPLDIPSVAIACVVLIAAVAAAAVWPAVRAGRIDPLAALRAP
jgi:predicted lysophospholipase L1 biosynthesis ABC-type transport system permease subunit